MRDDSQAFVAQTVRVPEELMARLRVKLAQDGVKAWGLRPPCCFCA
jgi:hypothetical protein